MKTKVSYLQFEKLVQLQTPSVDAQILSCQNPCEPSIIQKKKIEMKKSKIEKQSLIDNYHFTFTGMKYTVKASNDITSNFFYFVSGKKNPTRYGCYS